MDFNRLRETFIQAVREQMPIQLDRLNWSKDQLEKNQLQSLRHILKHAKQHTKYYKKILSDIDPDNFQIADLNKIPITTKQDTLDHWDDFVIDNQFTREQAEAHLQQFRDGKIDNPFYQDQYLFFATGGSSGQRGLFVWNIPDFAECVSLVYRYQIRDEQKNKNPSRKMATVVAPSWLHASLPVFSINVDPAIEIRHYSADTPLDVIAKQLNDYQPDYLIGYSSVIVELSHAARSGRLNINPQRVSTNSEILDDEGRASIYEAWNVEVNNMWGSVEAGILGVEDDAHEGMWLSDDYCIVEPVDEQLNPVASPEDARRLVITNLYNHTFPVIRYVLDDAVVIDHPKGQTFGLAKTIQGRADDWFVYQDTTRIHPMTFRHVLGQDAAISEYQVEQTEDGAEIRLIADTAIDTEALKDRLVEELTQAGLPSPTLTVIQLNQLPRHEETGKLKRFIALK